MNFRPRSKDTNLLTTSILTILAILLNVVFVYAVSKLNLIVFLDTIFTVALTFYAGLVPGLIAAAVYNPIMTLIYCAENGTEIFYFDFLYLICGMLIVLTTWAFSRNKKEFHSSTLITILYLLTITIVSSLVSCISASVLDTFVRPLFGKTSPFGPIEDFSYVFQHFNFGHFLSFLLPRIPITVLDRLICTFAGYGIYRLLSKATHR